MNKHTKGPWIVGDSTTIPRDNDTYAEAYAVTNLDGTNIADVCLSGPWIDDVSEAEGSANLSLITAAPELLEALEQLVSDITQCPEYVGPMKSHGFVIDVIDAIESARKVIKKAKGEN